MAILRAKAAPWPLLNDRTGSAVPRLRFDCSLCMRMFATSFYAVLYGWRKPRSTRSIGVKYRPDRHFAFFKIKL